MVTEACTITAHWWPPGHIIGYEHAFIHAVADFINAIDGTTSQSSRTSMTA